MIGMAKQPKKKPGRPKAPPTPQGDPPPILFRPISHALVEDVDTWAERNRRSRNMELNVLVEEALRARGPRPAQEGE